MTEPNTPATPLPDDTLARWRNLAEKATPGPWDASTVEPDGTVELCAGGPPKWHGHSWEANWIASFNHDGGRITNAANAALAAEARSALPALLDEVHRLKADRLAEAADDAVTILELRDQNRRLEEELQKARDAVQRLQDHIDAATAP